MLPSDREKWDAKYSAAVLYDEVSPVVSARNHFFPSTGRAVDVAGGTGRHAVWLAQRGMDVTLVDVSNVALSQAQRRAREAKVVLHRKQLDLQHDPFPKGPWDLIFTMLYWQPSLFAQFTEQLSPGGKLIVIQPTIANLTRHARPARRFLVVEDELLELVKPLNLVYFEANWLEAGRHDVFLVAERR